MRRRGSRSVTAVLLAWAPAVTAVVLALGPGRASAADTASCSNNVASPCPPAGSVSSAAPGSSGGQVVVTWNSTDRANATPDPTSASLTITWTPVGQVPPTAPSLPTEPVTPVGSCPQQATPTMVCSYSWPSDLEVNGYVINGTYTVTAMDRACTLLCTVSSAPGTVTQTIAVANPPVAPTGVTAAPGPTPGTVTISWAPNPEPDIVGYEVLRGDGSVACDVPFQPPVPKKYSCVDAPPKDGSYTYKVVAHRWGATYNDAVKAEPGTASGATKTLTVTGTSPATATTVAGGTPGTLGPPGFKPNLVPIKPAGNTGGAGGGGFNPNLVAPGTTVEPSPGGDAGFQPTLPYGSRSTAPPTTDPAVITAPPVHKAGRTSVGSIAVVGAGLLIAVIALHGLWLRSEVRRAGVLEPLDPES